MVEEEISETLYKELKCQQRAARHPCKVQQYHVDMLRKCGMFNLQYISIKYQEEK